ncbi:GlcG/HbpS family heme-binding protein [Bradyrhizobium elkanii]|uniref:GlcG/HbpS family heme-binding protein n=1 Tax=Bradyrhizobium elkanii TaxID=29448 RepID=UPI003B967CA5
MSPLTAAKATFALNAGECVRRLFFVIFAPDSQQESSPLSGRKSTQATVRICEASSVAQDGTSLMRAEIAHGKAYGALALGMGSRALFQRAQEQAYFVDAVNTLAQGRMVPVPGGVLIMDGATLIGAVGVSGDTSDNDELCAVAGIEAAGLKANAG